MPGRASPNPASPKSCTRYYRTGSAWSSTAIWRRILELCAAGDRKGQSPGRGRGLAVVAGGLQPPTVSTTAPTDPSTVHRSALARLSRPGWPASARGLSTEETRGGGGLSFGRAAAVDGTPGHAQKRWASLTTCRGRRRTHFSNRAAGDRGRQRVRLDRTEHRRHLLGIAYVRGDAEAGHHARS
jgi:hypothetical protein